MTNSSLAVSLNSGNSNSIDFHKYDNRIYIVPEKGQDTVEIQNEEKVKKKGRGLGIGIALSSLVVAGGVFLLTKGLPKGTTKFLKDHIDKIEEKINLRNLKGESVVITALYLKVLSGLNKFANRATSINNFTSLKDILFDKFMSKNRVTKKICTSITSFFEKIAKNTVDSKYTKLDKKFTNLFLKFSKLNQKQDLTKKVTINGVEKTVEEWIKILGDKQKDISSKYTTGFGLDSRVKRYNSMKSANEGLDQKVWETALNGMNRGQSFNQNLSNLRDSSVHRSFIAEDLLEADKIELNKEVSKIRNLITYDIDDKYTASKMILKDISKSILPDDVDTNKIIKSLRGKINVYKKLNGANEQQLRTKLSKDIQEELQLLQKNFVENGKFTYDEKVVEEVSSCIANIEKVLTSTDDKGILQEMLTIYKAILPKKDYLKIKKEVFSTIKRLDRTIDIENNKFFDKLRDLGLGSAPTDVLTLLGSIGGVGIGLLSADNSDERKSAWLKYGIPVVGGVATSLLLTVRMVAGFKSLALGMLSSLAMNKIGTGIDKHRKLKNNKENNESLVQNAKNELETK